MDPLAASFLQEVEALQVEPAPVGAYVRSQERPLVLVRGYDREDLFAVAEVAYVYLFGGHEQLARVLFEGLAAVAPHEPYFALALGLTYDLCQDLPKAEASYARAAQLDPKDPRPDVNRAELRIERRQYQQAHQLLVRAQNKSADPELSAKIDALRLQVERLAKTVRA